MHVSRAAAIAGEPSAGSLSESLRPQPEASDARSNLGGELRPVPSNLAARDRLARYWYLVFLSTP